MIDMVRASEIWMAVLAVVAACGGSEPNGDATAGAGASGGASTGTTANGGSGGSGQGGASTLTVTALQDGSYLCTPAGPPPFPGVLFNHGGLGPAVGGDLEGTCEALAEAGYVGYSKKRRETVPLAGHLDDVLAGLDDLRGQSLVDTDRIGILGFSRGGLLALQAALARADQIHAMVVMAPAPANGALSQTLADVSALTGPTLILVAENDIYQSDHVTLAQQTESALTQAGKEVTLTIYRPFGSDGHELFFEVRDPWWSDVHAFLDAQL